MFPLTPKPPLYKESFVVCLVDKYCAFMEFLGFELLGIYSHNCL